MLELFVELGKKQVDMFSSNHLTYMNCIVTCEGMRNIMMTVYKSLVHSKRLIALEEMPQDHKLQVWETAKEISNGRMDKKGTIQLSKILYTIEYYLNNVR